MTPLPVSLDLTPLLGPPTGIARFVAGVLPHLAADPGLEVRGWVLSARTGDLDDVGDDLPVLRLRLPARAVHRAWAAGIPFGRRRLGGRGLVHGTNYAAPPGPRTVLSVHDLTPFERTDVDGAVRGVAAVVRRAADTGAAIVTATDHVREKLIARLGVEPDRVATVPYGLDPIPPAPPGRGREVAGADRYVLALGTVLPRKNLVRLVRAAATLPADVGIVIAGPEGDDEPAVGAALGAADASRPVRRLRTVDEATRAALLRDATVLGYPSLDEGFGFPALEAMSVGVPVVAARAGSLPEVVGDGAVLVDPLDEEALAEALHDALDPARSAPLVERGRAVAAGYDWATTARGLAAVYQRTAAALA